MATKKSPVKKASKKTTRKVKVPARDDEMQPEEAQQTQEATTTEAQPQESDAPAALPKGDWTTKLRKARKKPVRVAPTGEVAEPLPVEVTAPPLHDELPPEDLPAPAEPAAEAAEPAQPAYEPPREVRSEDGLSLPEQYLLVALSDGWDDRQEKFKVGSHGPALVGALVLDLALRGRLKMQRDRFVVADGPTGDADLEPIAARLRELKGTPSADAMRRLGAGDLSGTIRPWKTRLAKRGLVEERTWRHLGLFKRSETTLLEPDAQGRLENRIRRLLIGGTPDAQSVCLMGLVDAAGLLPNLVTPSALDFNRKRIQGLVSGRDKLGYLADKDYKAMQEVLVTTVLANVKRAQRGG